jgi:hypothetical protein
MPRRRGNFHSPWRNRVKPRRSSVGSEDGCEAQFLLKKRRARIRGGHMQTNELLVFGAGGARPWIAKVQ